MQKSIAEVKKLIGHDIVVEPEWQLLWAELQKHYSDNSRFVPDVVQVVVAWFRSLCELAEDDTNEEWTETLLDKLKSTHMLKILFDVRTKPQCASIARSHALQVTNEGPSTSWSDKHNVFEIRFPKNMPISQSRMLSGFHTELRQAFEVPSARTMPDRIASSAHVTEEGFTDVDPSDFDSTSILTPATTERFVSRAPTVDALPNMRMLERPEDLMRKPPYHMILTHNQYGKFITIQGSHQPSLELIAEYFKKWCKKNHNQSNRVFALSSVLHEVDANIVLASRRRDHAKGKLLWSGPPVRPIGDGAELVRLQAWSEPTVVSSVHRRRAWVSNDLSRCFIVDVPPGDRVQVV